MLNKKSTQNSVEAIMKPVSFVIQLPRQRRRAVELYSRDTPFKPRVEKSQRVYTRRVKHVQQEI